jgi:hypothetical protein
LIGGKHPIPERYNKKRQIIRSIYQFGQNIKMRKIHIIKIRLFLWYQKSHNIKTDHLFIILTFRPAAPPKDWSSGGQISDN